MVTVEVTFQRCIEISRDEFMDYFDLHKVHLTDLDEMMEIWKRKQIIGWKFSSVKLEARPRRYCSGLLREGEAEVGNGTN